MNFYKGHITELKENEIFVFGSNGQGFHGAGSAGFASFGKAGNIWRDENYSSKPDGWHGFWNIKGVARGLQSGTNGTSYAIQTVTRPGALKSISPEEMKKQIRKLYQFAINNPDKKFYIAQENRIGFNGWEPEVMAECYKCLPIPENIYFEEGFAKLVQDTVVYYAGIGSRETPDDIYKLMTKTANELMCQGFVLRSGGAEGADQAFGNGTERADIYLPWKDFEKKAQRDCHNNIVIDKTDKEAEESINQYHPNGENLKPGARSMMRRNYRQVVGRGDQPDSAFVICWTDGGGKKGGTAQAIRIADDREIPVINLGLTSHLSFLKKYLLLND